MKMRPFTELIAARTALERLLGATAPVPRRERLPLEEAVGRRSARPVVARGPVPPFARATWDGYALVASSTKGATNAEPARLKLVGEVFAETPRRRAIRPGEAVAIATGGPLPPGANAVVMFEEVRVDGTHLVVPRAIDAGDRLAEVGDDFPKGAQLAAPDEMLSPAALGTFAAAGETSAEVWARPRVAVIPNGNELRTPGARLAYGTIYESNNATLGALARALGAEVTTHAPVIDDAGAIEAVIRASLVGTDLLLVTGGSSVGEHDFLPQIFPRLGKLLFHGIAVRPGKPTLAVRAGRTLVIGMPGHPTSCLANGLWLVAPVLSRMGHGPDQPWPERSVVLDEPYDVPTSSYSTVVPLAVEGDRARPTFRTSSSLTSLVPANAFVLLPPNRPSLRKGDVVAARFLPAPLGAVAAPKRTAPRRKDK